MPKPKKIAFAQMRSPDAELESLSVNNIEPFALNPRLWFDEVELQKLAESLKANSQIAPIIVRQHSTKSDCYEVVVGERRVRASRMAELEYIKAEVRELSDREALILAQEENSNRVDPSPIAETISTLNLIKLDTDLEHEEIKSLLYQLQKGRNVPTDFQEAVDKIFDELKTVTLSTFIKDRLRLLNLPPEVYRAVAEGSIEHTKGIAIAKLKDEVQRQSLLTQAIEEKLTLSNIKAEIASLQGKQTVDYSVFSQEELKERVKSSYKQLSSRKKLWLDPKKRKKLEILLKNLDELISS